LIIQNIIWNGERWLREIRRAVADGNAMERRVPKAKRPPQLSSFMNNTGYGKRGRKQSLAGRQLKP
jgi:hypothetical protein